jgi:diguanylate cyclase (GGDEF)-like protein/PAS domain S-box-containing protein
VTDPREDNETRAGQSPARRRLPTTEGLDAGLAPAKVRALFRTAFTSAPIGMAIVDEHGRIVIANDALARISGVAAGELAALTFADLSEPEDRDVAAADHRQLLAGELARYETRMRLRRPDGTTVWVAVTVAHDGDIPERALIYQVQDISERRAVEGQLEYLIDHDFLTGLFNRRRFEQELERQLDLRQRFGGRGAVLIVDLDGFKEVNDQFGHAVGDELLRTLSAALRDRARATDVLARLGGDEFALLLPGADREQAQTVATQTIALVARHVAVLGGERAQVTASVGVALFDDLSDVQLMALADAALYAAKESGRNRFVVLSAGEDTAGSSRHVGEAHRLRRAIDEERFVLYCQPVRDLVTGRVALYELLIRMRGEAPGELVEPNAFLYAAERFHLIADIDRWVISQAVRLIAREERRGRRIVLAANVSGRSVSQPALTSHLDRELDVSGIDPSSLVFELTETAAISNLEAAQGFSRHLHHRGCRFALDDFGAGFASFYYLKNLAFDVLKIDGDFVRGLRQNPIDQLVIGAIVTIARGMGKQTVAEFVADEQTSDLLLASGVDYAQGFHIARPRPVEEVLAESP